MSRARGTDRDNPMDRDPDRKLLAGLVATAATSSAAGPRNLVASLQAARSPGRSDRFNAIAVEWLRRWWPKTALVALPQCSCPAGRCEACN
jgi:hypothetical protein